MPHSLKLWPKWHAVAYRVEPYQCHEQANVHERKPVPRNIAGRAQNVLRLVERGEQRLERLLVWFLRLCKAAPVDTVVDVVVDPGVELLQLLSQVGGLEVHVWVLGNGVEVVVEDVYDVETFVVHNRFLLFIPQHWDCVLAYIR